MNAPIRKVRTIRPLAITARRVTLSRADYEALLNAAEAAHDRVVFDAFDTRVAKEGWEAVKAEFLPLDLMQRLLDGESRVRIWRERRGLSQRALAKAALVSPSYLADIEAGRRKGQTEVQLRLAKALGISLETLLGD